MPPIDFTFEEMLFAAGVVATGLSLGIVAALGVLAFWPKLKQSLFAPDDFPKVRWQVKDIFYIIFIYILLQVAFGGATFLLSKGKLLSNESLHYVSLFWATFVVNLIVILYLVVFLKKRYGVRMGDFGLRPKKFFPRLGAGILGYFAFLPVFFLLMVTSAVLCSVFGIQPKPHPVVEIFQTEKSVAVIAGLSIFAMTVGPVLEEIFFRGFVYPVLKGRWGTRAGLFATAAFFALVHGNAFQFLPIFGLGLLLTFLYEATGTLTASITLHALNNSISVFLTLALLRFLK